MGSYFQCVLSIGNNSRSYQLTYQWFNVEADSSSRHDRLIHCIFPSLGFGYISFHCSRRFLAGPVDCGLNILSVIDHPHCICINIYLSSCITIIQALFDIYIPLDIHIINNNAHLDLVFLILGCHCIFCIVSGGEARIFIFLL